ncbi:hypothetical protein [Methylobacterium radiotolerans]|uniref:hypothetical protein n=1 Tax=Methylobacterium radiotolerans TaxID=31998 RepID=UPI0011BF3491|nr:hypothetical protein [Methylobacterium radiotolerans]
MAKGPSVQLAHLRVAAREANPIGGSETQAALMILAGMMKAIGWRSVDEWNGVVHSGKPQPQLIQNQLRLRLPVRL